MKNVKTLLLAIGASAILFACDKDDDDDEGYNNTDQNFAMMAGISNFAEIDAGQTASTKGESAGVRQFGSMMVADHTTAQDELQSIAAGLRLYAPDSLDATHVALKQKLATLSGRAFDSVYIHSQVTDHQNAINLFELEVNSGQNGKLREYAASKLPHLEMHLHHADSLANLYK
jgi:putative membrane protein